MTATATKANYAWGAEGAQGTVFSTSDPVDNDEVFATFTEARTALVNWLNGIAAEYRNAAREAQQLRKSDVDGPDHDLVDPKAVLAGE